MSNFLNLVTIFGITMRNVLQISTNMPGIGLEICEISENFEKQNDFVG